MEPLIMDVESETDHTHSMNTEERKKHAFASQLFPSPDSVMGIFTFEDNLLASESESKSVYHKSSREDSQGVTPPQGCTTTRGVSPGNVVVTDHSIEKSKTTTIMNAATSSNLVNDELPTNQHQTCDFDLMLIHSYKSRLNALNLDECFSDNESSFQKLKQLQIATLACDDLMLVRYH